MLQMADSKYHWMKERITRLWPDWREAAKALEREKPAFRNRQFKDVSRINENTTDPHICHGKEKKMNKTLIFVVVRVSSASGGHFE